ncbi:MAG: SHOCT domain-containing protein [Bacteroidetes bacterium]|nr:SHOCT domain-containing protein [Bacteroidota bacterium]
MHFFHSYYFFGMHLLWWIFFCALMVWIFVTPYDIPGQRRKPESPQDILRRRLASGEITEDEYRYLKRILENE